jgi:hypothetical protein
MRTACIWWRFPRLRCLSLCFVLGLLPFSPRQSAAHEIVAATPGNLRWHAPAHSVTATFLGKDEKETATLALKKAAVVNTEISIQSDATAISLVVGENLHIVFPVSPGPDGAITRLKLGGGDSPALLLNGKEQVRLRGKWIEAVESKERYLTVELQNATFAEVKFDPKSVEGEPAPKPAEPGGTPSGSRPRAEVAETGGPGGDEPVATGSTTASQLKAAADAFANGVSRRCPRCSGKGTVIVSVQVGTRQEGRIIRPIYRDQTKTCDKCRGSGHLRASDEVLNRLAGRFLKTLAGVKRDDPKTQDAISASYKMITDSMIGDYKTWTLLTENGRSILSQKSPALGTPVIAKVLVKKVLPRVGEKRQFMVQVGGTDKMVQVADPVSADEIESGPALMGGIITTSGATGRAPLLAQGFLVAPPVEKGWYWWYWWRPKYVPPDRDL